jgi:hypothetical protein
MTDYLSTYMTDKGFDFSQLLNDDFFLAIKLLFNHGYFVSCAKLIASFIDTMAFVEYGDVPGNFVRWLDTYVDLKPVGVTSEELWEYRNSLLHMTNLESRKVLAGKVKKLVPVVINRSLPINVADLPTEDNSKFFDLYKLIQALSLGAGEKWPQSFNAERDKFKTFIERYDLIISDKRQFPVVIDNPQ